MVVTTFVLITMETGGAAGAELAGELLDAGTAGAEAGAEDGPGAWICPSPIWETMGWEACRAGVAVTAPTKRAVTANE